MLYHPHLSPPISMPFHWIHNLPSHATAAGFNANPHQLRNTSTPSQAPTNWTRNRNLPQRRLKRTTTTIHRWWGGEKEQQRVGRRARNVQGTLPHSPCPCLLTFIRKTAANCAQEDTAANAAGAPTSGMACDMVLVWVGYGMGFPSHGTMVLVWSSYATLEWGTL